jgi:CheY-like chemotaxis protein
MRVVDDGIGMDSATLSRIFEPFFTTKFAGRGLGLAAVQGIVRGHSGAMDYRSEPGRGTVFEVYFPGATPAHERSTADSTALTSAWRGAGTILLADDEASVRAVTARMLERLGFDVVTANDGREAVEVYRASTGNIDLVILDLTMPNVDGIEAFAQLRAFDPGVRVVLASGYSQSDVNARVADSRLEGTLQKPYSLAKLSDLLSTLMPRSSTDPRPPA